MANVFRNKAVKILIVIFAVIIILLSTTFIGTCVRRNWKPWQPDYEKVDVTPILNKTVLSTDDYNLLFRQTGLTKLGIDEFLQNGNKSAILEIQKSFFESQDIYFNEFAPFMGYMRRSDNSIVPHAKLKNGDILFTPSTFLSFIEMAHCSMVIDEISESLIQANGYGSSSNVCPASNIFTRPAFIILRANEDSKTRDAVSNYAKNNLLGLTYDILAGIFESKAPSSLERTHCSHIIWYAYNHFGIDIDSNGGKIVTPHDIASSTNLSIVQVYGIDINDYL